MSAIRTPEACIERLQQSRALKSEWRDTRPVVYFYQSRNGVWLSSGEAMSPHAKDRPYIKCVEGVCTERGIA